ncbi:MAG: retropepsin-like aspartic protease [Flavobacteriaceae bacterium]
MAQKYSNALYIYRMIRTLSALLRRKGYVRVPLTKLASGHYICKLTLNDVDGVFIVDTGASHTCVALEKEAHFLLNSTKAEKQAASASSADMDTRQSTENHLRIGSWEQSKQELILFDMTTVNEALVQLNEDAVDGILGADVLHATKAVLDYRRNGLFLKF